MKFVGALVFASAVAAVFGAALLPGKQPQEDALEKQYQELERYLRESRSSYPGAYFAPAPCASAPIPVAFHAPPPHHAPVFAPAISPYGVGFSGIPQYRGAEEDEMLAFSEMDPMQEQMMAHHSMLEQQAQFGHMPTARYVYSPAAAIPGIAPAFAPAASVAAASSAAAAAAAAASAAAPAIGVFPNANVGGCSVPLLLSCSPSIKPGHIVKSHAYSSYGGEAYRGVAEPTHEGHEVLDAQQHLAPAHDSAPAVHPMHQ